MVFFRIAGTLSENANEGKQKPGLFDRRGKVDGDQIAAIQAAVENLIIETKRHKMRIDVSELHAKGFAFIVVAEFGALKEYPLKKAAEVLLNGLLLEGKVAHVEEITESAYNEMLRNAERRYYCASADDIREEFDISSYNGGFRHIERKIEQINYGAPRTKTVSLKRMKAYAGSLACTNLTEETERVAANKKYGTPVHYKILTEKIESSKEIYNFLLHCLNKNGRILRSVVNIWSVRYQDRPDRFFKEDIQKLYNKSEYGAVIIKSEYEEFSGDEAPWYYGQIKQICEVIKANRKNVLTILCFEKGAEGQQKAFMNNLGGMAFIDIEEKVMFKDAAESFLQAVAKNDTYKNGQKVADKICETLTDGRGYARAELTQMYDDFCVAHKKAVEFPEYDNFAVVEERVDKKVEGVAYLALQSMIGLKSVKEQINNIVNFAKVQKMALDKGLKSAAVTKHMVFTGNPGTAKTTVARLFAQIMRDNKLLTGGRFVEAGRADLVGQYVGHTAPKVREKFEEAKGGVLFIDEAYSLVDDKNGLYGDEAINTIVKQMENNRENTIVIFAGYKKEMAGFINRNSGLKSRVAHYVDFPDYSAEELVQILELMIKQQDLTLDGRENLEKIMAAAVRQNNFGNGRFARNLLDKARLRQAGRIAKMDKPEAEDILRLSASDFEMPEEFCVHAEPRTIGF